MSSSGTEGARLAVSYSPAAAAWFAARRAEAELAPHGAPATLYRSVLRLVTDIISDPVHAFDLKYRLRPPLGSVFRVKAGRLRVFFLASSTHQRSIVLAVGFRKEGDKRDAYTELERWISRGDFDPQFAELGISRPKL